MSNRALDKLLTEHTTIERREKHNRLVEKNRDRHKKRINISMEDVVKDIESGMLIKDVQKKYNISKNALHNRRIEYEQQYGKINKKKIARPIRKEIKIILPMEDVVRDIANRMPLKEVAKKYHVSESTLRERRQEYEEKYGKIEKIEKTEEHIIKRPRRELPMEEVAEDIRKRMPLKDILDKYQVTKNIFDARRKEYEAIHGKIKKVSTSRVNKVSIKPEQKESIKKEPSKPKKINIKQLWEQYTNGANIKELAFTYKIDEKLLQKKLEEYRNLIMAKAYLKGTYIGELAYNYNLPLETVKEGVQNILSQYIKQIPASEYLRCLIKYKKMYDSKVQMYRQIILDYEKKKRQENRKTKQYIDRERD